MLDFSRLTSLDFIFNTRLGTLSHSFANFFYVFFGSLLIVALASHLILRKKEKQKNLPTSYLWQRLTNMFLVMGIAGFILLFFRQQKAYWISMPFFWYLWFIGGLIWAGYIFRWAQTGKKKLEQEIKERKEREKYLP
ncbi:hypothetical protein L6278_00460 [Candidatus Parcubacteria bacterium]|nr:hypothetical protein [Patescibacteria group bacterium]MBU4481927.1 hypothetical protein [Patescibacteria group bacterium]MCG2686591.1 hypothetical protein [Candidatus Parcubacteria bacterium]